MELPLLRLGECGDLVRHPDRPAAFGCAVDDLFTLKESTFFMQFRKNSKYKKVRVCIIVDHKSDRSIVSKLIAKSAN